MTKLVTIATQEPLQPVREGMWERHLVDEPALRVVEMFFDKGIETKAHGHDVNQAAYHVSGKFELTMAGKVTPVGPGDAYFIPSGEVHSVLCLEKGSYVLTTARVVGMEARSDHERGHGDGHDQHKH